MGKSSVNVSFSIAMLNNQMVKIKGNKKNKSLLKHEIWGVLLQRMWFTPRLDGERAPQNFNKPARARREPHSDQPKLI